MKTYIVFAVFSVLLAALLFTVSCEAEGAFIRNGKSTRPTATRRIARKNKQVKAARPVAAAAKPAADKEADKDAVSEPVKAAE